MSETLPESVSEPTWEISLYEIPSPIKLGVSFGFIVKGWTLKHYVCDAGSKDQGFETVVIWGTQGNGKSTRLLQILYWIYKFIFPNYDEKTLWELVLDRLVFRPADFIDTVEAVDDNFTLAALGWDDIGVHYPSTKFKTDIKAYEAIDSTWAAIRTKCHVIIVTLPLIDRLAKNIKDNATFELFIGKNQLQIINRWFRLPGKKADSNFFKATIERPKKFEMYFVPQWVWRLYWAKRIELTKEALKNLKSVSKGDVTGYIPVLDAGEISFTQNISYSTSTIQQDISRGVIRGERVGDLLLVNEDDYYRALLLRGGVDYRKKEPEL